MRNTRCAAPLALLVTACAAFSLVPQGSHRVHAYSVTTPISWSRCARQGNEIWTADGELLESLVFFRGIRQGETLFSPAEPDEDLPSYQRSMAPGEIMDFFVDSMARMGARRLKTVNLRPVAFGDLPGFRFEMSFVTEGGLEMQGLAVGSVIEERLYLISYWGARLYYYEKYAPHVQQIIESIRVE